MFCKHVFICPIIITNAYLFVCFSFEFFCIPYPTGTAKQKDRFFSNGGPFYPTIISLSSVLYLPDRFIIMAPWCSPDFLYHSLLLWFEVLRLFINAHHD